MAREKDSPGKNRYGTRELIQVTGLNREALRFYERKGLLVVPPRTDSGYRIFSEEAVKQISFIKETQGLGFTLREIKELMNLGKKEKNCAHVAEKIKTKLVEVKSKEVTLRKMKKALEKMLTECQEKETNICHIFYNPTKKNILGETP